MQGWGLTVRSSWMASTSKDGWALCEGACGRDTGARRSVRGSLSSDEASREDSIPAGKRQQPNGRMGVSGRQNPPWVLVL